MLSPSTETLRLPAPWPPLPRARYYRLTAAGRRALGQELESWRRFAAGLEAILRVS